MSFDLKFGASLGANYLKTEIAVLILYFERSRLTNVKIYLLQRMQYHSRANHLEFISKDVSQRVIRISLKKIKSKQQRTELFHFICFYKEYLIFIYI